MAQRLVMLMLLLLWGSEQQAEGNYRTAGASCETTKADVVLLVDQSGSISPQDFRHMKSFISEVVNNIHIGPFSFQIGLTKYNDEATTEWDLNTHRTKESLLTAINRIQQAGGGTATGKALEHILHHSFKPAVGMRADSKKVAILITDGQSQDEVAPAAKNLKDTGIETFVIGVGLDVDNNEMKIIASGDVGTHVYIITDFRSLLSIINSLTHSLCHSAPSTDSVRLVNGTSLCSGRLEVKTSQSNQNWSLVCKADFDWEDADVVCKELGCGSPSALKRALYGEVEAPRWTAKFKCEGTESSLLDCRRSGSVRNTCPSNKAIRLTCLEPIRLVGGASRCEGTLEVKLRSWKPVTASGWTEKEAAAACRDLECGSLASMGTRNDSSVGGVWQMEISCLKSGRPLRQCASQSISSSQSSTVLELVCSDLLDQPNISVSSREGLTSSPELTSVGMFLGFSFTISCSVQPQYPGGSFRLSFTSFHTTHSYALPASNHSAHFLFPAAEPAHGGSYRCVYNVHVFSHNFSSDSHVLFLRITDPTVFLIRLVVLLLTLLIFISVIYWSHKVAERPPGGSRLTLGRKWMLEETMGAEVVEEQEEAAL